MDSIKNFWLPVWIIILLRSTFTVNAQEWMSLSLDYGPYKTGFRYIETSDPGRPCLSCAKSDIGYSAREMEIAVWYPSEDQETGTMPYIQYLRLGPAGTITDLYILKHAFFKSIAGLGGDTSLFESTFAPLFHEATRARKDRTLAKGSWPLILYPDQPHLQNILCEFLASHGYIVASPRIRGTFNMDLELNPGGIETGSNDLDFTLGYMRSHFPVQQDFAVIGTGFNASLGLNQALKNKDLAALISLEGGITTPFEAGLNSRSPYYDLQRCTVPMLVIHAPHPDVKPELTHRYKYSERVYQSYPQSSEFYFLNFGLWEKKLKNIFPKANRGNTWESFEAAAGSISAYLDWKLKGNPESKALLLKKTWPSGIVQTSIQTAVSLPPGIDTLIRLHQQNGFQPLQSLYLERRKSDHQPFAFNTFYQISQHLIGRGEFRQALEWAGFYAETFPQSAIPFAIQGRAQLELGDRVKAKILYEKAIALLPADSELNDGEKSYFRETIEGRIRSL